MAVVCYNVGVTNTCSRGKTKLPMLYKITSLVCHQAPSRTLVLAGTLMPLCARCTGIYSGFLVGALYQVLLFDRGGTRLPGTSISLTSLGLILLLAVDGVASRLGASLPGNSTRLLLGLLGGFSISLLAVPLLNRFVRVSGTDGPVIRGWKPYLRGLILIAVLFAAHFVGSRAPLYTLSYTSTAGLTAAYLVTTVTAAAAITRWPSSGHTPGKMLLFICLSILLLALEVCLLQLTAGARN